VGVPKRLPWFQIAEGHRRYSRLGRGLQKMFQIRPMVTENVPDSAEGYRRCSRFGRGLPKMFQIRPRVTEDVPDSAEGYRRCTRFGRGLQKMFQTRPMITEDVPDSADGYRKCSRLCRGLPKLSQTRSILYDKTDSTSILVLWLADMYILMHPGPYESIPITEEGGSKVTWGRRRSAWGGETVTPPNPLSLLA
jgi:hypothetical protein